ncbi:putative ring-like domain-containing protein [Phaeoacremonium minimum UCRPA7]|uniref:Putative ring-like domain-containing protein n=1 Tax=Phaeoacremonium minimum (strain UCR-PA7) TaxID=1286976 RepID=R8BUR1_PHAM7|nr:putative ring-like domain-containing protein [Phaeoacremonium minimum UCRPA7]EOO03108.1 putative ring-like domain-containing protein [Phaeoacremonium minimum UCRPA7]
MLEYFSYKKFKKTRDEKLKFGKDNLETKPEEGALSITVSSPKEDAESLAPVLTDDDERFFERLTSPEEYTDEDGNRPPLPPRVMTPDISLDSDAESFQSQQQDVKGKGKAVAKEAEKKADKKANRFPFFMRKNKKLEDAPEPSSLVVPEREAEKEQKDISRLLDDLNLAAKNNKTFSLSEESSDMLAKFTLILKDLVNGVPTAAKDLQSLFEDHDGTLARNYEKLPKSMKKLVTQLPNKLTTTLAPELLAVAAEAQGLSAAEASTGGLKGAAKKFLTPKNLQELVTKPSAIVGLLKGIMNALKARWPAFMGTNVIWSIALFILMFVLWYCHKRGREVRLEKADKENPIDGSDRVEELPDDPTLPAPATEP